VSSAEVVARGRAAWWALRATAIARGQLGRGGVDALDIPPAPPTPAEARTWAQHVVRLCAKNCLVRAAVRQAWYAGQGREVDIVIGVTSPSEGFRAHAWLAIDPPQTYEGYEELARRPARALA
jgi:hypothetical protein